MATTVNRSTTEEAVLPAKPQSKPTEMRTEPARQTTASTDLLRAKKARKKMIQRIVLILVVLAIAFGAYEYFKPSAVVPVSIRYAAVDRGDMVHSVTATGTLQAFTTVNVGTQVSGTLLKLYADFNTVVKSGQLLAQLDPILFQEQVNSDKANLQQAQAALDYARADVRRADELLKQNLMSQADYDLKRSTFLGDSAQVLQIKAALQKSTTNLGLTTIKSPVKGTVQSRSVDVGQTVAASLNAPTLFLIAEDLTNMEVAASVDEADIGQVRVGQDVKFGVEAYPGESFDGKVLQIRINPITLQNVVTYNVMITTDNTSGKLLPGMTATANIICDSRKNVLKVPSSALQMNPPTELLPEAPSAQAANGKPGQTHHQGLGQASQHKGGSKSAQGGATVSDTSSGILYVKAKGTAKNQQQLIPVQVITGLTDGATTEIISSKPPLAVGDSIVVSIFVPTPAAGASSSPLTNSNSRGTPGAVRRF